MKRFFNHNRKPYEKWDEKEYIEEGEYYAEEGYEAEEGEYYAEEGYEAEEGEYYAEEGYEVEEGEYYAEEGYEVEEGEYYAEEGYEVEEGEYYAEEGYESEEVEYYAEEGYEAEGVEYYAEEGYEVEEGEYYAEEGYEAEEGEYYAEEEEYTEGIYGTRLEEKGGIAALFQGLLRMETMDRIMVATGIGVLILALITGGVYVSAKKVDEQVNTFVSVGTQLEGISLIGEKGLMAVADAQLARMEAAELVEKEDEKQPEYNENEYKNITNVALDMVSIKQDLKIKFTNKKTDKLISNVPFSVTVTTPDGKNVTWTDDDKDGIIYKKGIAGGKYKVAVDKLTEEKYGDYILPVGAESVTVKEEIVYEKVDVKNEIKTEAQVNAAAEDTKKNETEVESVPEDTVQWVESTKVANTYIEVAKSTIPDPLTLVARARFMRTANYTGSINSDTLSLEVGGTSALSVSYTDGLGGAATPTNVTWSSDNSAIATVDASGVVTAVAAGKATISYSAEFEVKDVSGNVTGTETVTGECVVTVTAPPEPVKEITMALDKTSVSLLAAEAATINATIENATLQAAVTAVSSDTKVATVSVNDKAVTITGVAPGNATITVKYVENDKEVTATCAVTVAGKLAMTLDKTAATVVMSKPVTINATVSNATTQSAVTAVSSNTKVATVSVNNKAITITGVAAGTATITVSYEENGTKVQATCAVTVSGNIAMVLNKTAATVFLPEPVTVTATISNALTQTAVTAESSDTKVATVSVKDKTVTITGVAAGSATVTIKYTENGAEVKATCAVTVKAHPKNDKNTKLLDTSGRQLFVLEDNKYREAVYADYYTASQFFLRGETKYTGWQTIDGKVYFFDSTGKKVTGDQVIQGGMYSFDSNGALITTDGVMGIDVSKWNGNIDWKAVKNSGISYVIIRSGYRGSSKGALIEDSKFQSNIKGATEAGLKVGIYFFTQAIDEVEAVEEASMVLEQIKGYKITYPIFLDVEPSGGRADKIDKATRTAVCKAFCETIQDAGHTAGIYANKTWLNNKIDTGQLKKYKIWLAQYSVTPNYSGRYEMWQYSKSGRINGISGDVDLNMSYLGY